jgi:hypothetical protein
MEIPGGVAINPAAETLAATAVRRVGADQKDQVATKQTAQALDQGKKGERGGRSAERREEGRGLQLDIRA